MALSNWITILLVVAGGRTVFDRYLTTFRALVKNVL